MKSTEGFVESIIRADIRQLKPYAVADASGMLKLDAMENPFSLPAELHDAWLQSLAHAPLNRYPSPDAPQLKKALKEVMNVSAEFDVVLGNGSDEIIQLLIAACCDEKRGVLSFEPSFVMYKMISQFMRVPHTSVELEEDFSLNLEKLVAADKEHNPAVVFIAQPNNPSANLFDENVLHKFIEQTQALVVIDEAYLPFTQNDSLAFLNRHPNVVVMRTLSKAGFAGLRLGFLFSAPQWAQEIEKVRLPYNINVLTQLSAQFLLQHYSVFAKQAELLVEQRAVLAGALNELPEFAHVYPSEANFILAKLAPGVCAKTVHADLKQQGVLIKCMSGGHRLLENCLRFTVGNADENARLIAALKSALRA